MYAEERQQLIAQLVTRRGRVSVNDLATEFDVTTETVRRDLSTLERAGLLRRVHGGAVPTSAVAVMESGFVDRDASSVEEKRVIAKAALEVLPPAGSTILIDAGSTTAQFAAVLAGVGRYTVITHSVPIAARLVNVSNINLHLLPGRVRGTTGAAVGAETVAALADIRADVVFMATNGLTVDYGLTTPDREEAEAKRALIASGRRVVVLADSSKFGIESNIRFATLSQLDVLVTDRGVPADLHDRLTDLDIEVVIA